MPRKDTESIEERAAKKPQRRGAGRAASNRPPAKKDGAKKDAPPKRGAGTLTSAERVKRDLALVQDRILMGLTYEELGRKHGVSARQATRIHAAYKDSAQMEMSNEDALDIALDAILRIRAVQQKLAAIAENADNDSARIGALRSFVDTFWKEIELRQHMGMLPKNLGELHLVADVRYVSTKLADLFDKHHMSKEAKKELLGVLTSERPSSVMN